MLRVEQDNAICRISLNRPEVRNAFNAALIVKLTEIFERIQGDKAVRIVHLKGEGAVFSAGADLAWMRSMATASQEENYRDAKVLGRLFQVIDQCPKPVICEVQGAALGGGVGLVAASDIVIADRGSQFALSEVKLGLIPAVISPYVIQKIGISQARRYFLTAELFTAETARDIGLVHEVVDGALRDKVDEVISGLLGNGPQAVSEAKRLIRWVADGAEDLAETTYRMIAERRVSEEGQEGMTAFLEKRAPIWANKP